MTSSSSLFRSELRALLRLSLPVVTVQVGMMMMGFVDTIMVGRYQEAALAAGALGNFFSMIVLVLANGVLMALDPLLSQAVGAGDEPSVTRNLQRGLVLSGVLSVYVGLVYLAAGPLLRLFGQEPQLVAEASTYVSWMIPSVLPFLVFGVLRSTMQAYHKVRPVVLVILLANLANAALNAVLIRGRLGMPELGLEGSAIATLCCRWLMCLGLLLAGLPLLRPHLQAWTPAAWDWGALRRMFKVGLPIGLQITMEFGAFGTTLLMMGWLSQSALAGHQAAINLASMTYVVTLGVSVATGVRVGHAVGRGSMPAARISTLLGLLSAVLIMVAFALCFLTMPRTLAAWFTENQEVGAFAVAVSLLPIAAVFQVVDGVQVVCLGALRGLGDTKIPAAINLLGFWGLGIPSGYLLAFELGQGAQGLWWGLTVGLTAVAILLTLRVVQQLRSEVRRTDVDRPETPGAQA